VPISVNAAKGIHHPEFCCNGDVVMTAAERSTKITFFNTSDGRILSRGACWRFFVGCGDLFVIGNPGRVLQAKSDQRPLVCWKPHLRSTGPNLLSICDG
jgi:hypothetical protein